MSTKYKYDLYLAGAMHGRLGKDVLNERANAKALCKKLGLTYYDPAEDEMIRPNIVIDKKPNLKRMKHYVRKDDFNLDHCHYLVVLTGDISSSGTAWEMGRMFYRNKRPIIIIAPRMYDKEFVNFTTIKVSKISATQKQALQWVKRRIKCPS